MSRLSVEEMLQKLANRFSIYCVFSPVEENYIDIYDIDKFGNAKTSSLRRYRGISLQRAILKAYMLEFENKLI